MARRPTLPWREINDFVATLGTARTVDALGRLALERIGDLVPFDRGAGVFEYRCGAVPPCVHITPGAEEIRRGFNEYWRHRFPLPLDHVLRNRIIDFGLWENTEYVAEFLRPHSVRWAAGSKGPFQISVYRTGASPLFSDRDAAILEALEPHLRNLYTYVTTIECLERGRVRGMELRPDCRSLTRREAEVVRHVALRLSAREIATLLLSSPRTVERHIANIYEKLGVHCREEMLRRAYGRVP